ncbi:MULTISPECIES: OsmC family protein [Dietzia]|uniref:OsmC family protein n=1 Tax=Dietzia TaxID=37914 RepID=UPI000D089803|nr:MULTISPECIES: OsmC family protein [Dietzia]AVM63146.1 osmotically inducible protein OsmC [Dietzia sp. oral taxon 368]MCT1712146.1 OsmC family protein [Dietzia cinnamea]MCT2273513.1 OsmC family protein [Dietzia cinnamea]
MSGTVLEFGLDGAGTGVLHTTQIVGGEHSISAEGHSAFGGKDTAPSPLDYALAALASCTQVTGQIVAAGDKSISLGEWDVDLKAHLDNSVLVYGAEGVSNFRDVTVTVSVQTNLDEARFAEFAAEVERRCPIATLFRGSGVELTTEWTNRPLA